MRSVLIVEADDRLLRERADQLLMDGYEVYAASTAQAARIKLADAPDTLVLCSAGTAARDDRTAPRAARRRHPAG